MILYALVLPCAQRMTGMSESNTNALMARASICLLALGTMMMGISWNIWMLIPGKLCAAYFYHSEECLNIVLVKRTGPPG